MNLLCEVISVSLYVSVITQWGESALMMAINSEIASQLLEAGANIDLQDKVSIITVVLYI